MTQIILIEKNGNIKQSLTKDISRETLYKKCGLKKPDGFEKRTVWNVKINKENVMIELWAKTEGKAGMENKTELPPPIDEELYFGTCIAIRCNENKKIINLTTDVWNKANEILFGTFDDLEEDEEDEEDELEDVSSTRKTKTGYLKDDFVVDDDEEEDDDDEFTDTTEYEGCDEDEDEKVSFLIENDNEIAIDDNIEKELEEEEYDY